MTSLLPKVAFRLDAANRSHLQAPAAYELHRRMEEIILRAAAGSKICVPYQSPAAYFRMLQNAGNGHLAGACDLGPIAGAHQEQTRFTFSCAGAESACCANVSMGELHITKTGCLEILLGWRPGFRTGQCVSYPFWTTLPTALAHLSTGQHALFTGRDGSQHTDSHLSCPTRYSQFPCAALATQSGAVIIHSLLQRTGQVALLHRDYRPVALPVLSDALPCRSPGTALGKLSTLRPENHRGPLICRNAAARCATRRLQTWRCPKALNPKVGWFSQAHPLYQARCGGPLLRLTSLRALAPGFAPHLRCRCRTWARAYLEP
jgi:hypothetical protein